MITETGITLCPDHAAAWARGAIPSRPIRTESEARAGGCHGCEVDAMVASDQVVTSLVASAIEAERVPDADRNLFPLEVAAVRRLGRDRILLTLENGTRWIVAVWKDPVVTAPWD